MPGHIESMFDDCEDASDAGSVLRRASRTEAGWLARFARERAEQEQETLELGIERELQVRGNAVVPLYSAQRLFGPLSRRVHRVKCAASASC